MIVSERGDWSSRYSIIVGEEVEEKKVADAALTCESGLARNAAGMPDLRPPRCRSYCRLLPSGPRSLVRCRGALGGRLQHGRLHRHQLDGRDYAPSFENVGQILREALEIPHSKGRPSRLAERAREAMVGEICHVRLAMCDGPS